MGFSVGDSSKNRFVSCDAATTLTKCSFRCKCFHNINYFSLGKYSRTQTETRILFFEWLLRSKLECMLCTETANWIGEYSTLNQIKMLIAAEYECAGWTICGWQIFGKTFKIAVNNQRQAHVDDTQNFFHTVNGFTMETSSLSPDFHHLL